MTSERTYNETFEDHNAGGSMKQIKGILKTGRFEISYRVYGEGRDIICLNGIQQSMAMWMSFLRRFRDKYRITLFDFPHQGKGRVLHGQVAVSLDEEVGILHSLVQELEYKKISICAASWGGVIGLQFAARYPHYVDRLILGSIGMKPNERMKETILSGSRIEPNDREQMAKVLLKSFGSDLPPVCQKQIVEQFKSMQTDRIEAFSEHGKSVIFSGALDKTVSLSRVSKPVFILYGEKDKILDKADVESLVAALPEGRMRIVPHVGHFLHLENDTVFDVYEEILGRQDTDAALQP